MSQHRALKQELLKYRRRKSTPIPHAVQEHFEPGLSQFHISNRPVDLPHPQESYLANPAQEYRPKMNAPAVFWPDYDSQPIEALAHPVRLPQPRISRSSSNHRVDNGVELDGLIYEEPKNQHPDPVELNQLYEDSLRQQGFYDPEHLNSHTEDPEPQSWHLGQSAEPIPEQTILPEPAPQTISDHAFPEKQPKMGVSSLEQIVQQEYQVLTDAMNASLADPMATTQAAIQEINQAMEQAMQIPQPQQDDPFMQYQMMLNQQMQYMANPVMMPGMGPL
jgi:hypothetical protein